MITWTECNIPIRDFELKPGMLIEVQEDADTVQRYVIGHMTKQTGTCGGCCNRGYDKEPVIRWAMLDWAEGYTEPEE